MNYCYGGFSVSPFGIVEYFKRKNQTVFYYKETRDEYVRISEEEFLNQSFMSLTNISSKDYGETAKNLYQTMKSENTLIEVDYDKIRNDPVMIEIFEEYGSEKISGQCAKLEIEEVKKGCVVGVTDHDGYEKLDVIYDPDWYIDKHIYYAES